MLLPSVKKQESNKIQQETIYLSDQVLNTQKLTIQAKSKIDLIESHELKQTNS